MNQQQQQQFDSNDAVFYELWAGWLVFFFGYFLLFIFFVVNIYDYCFFLVLFSVHFGMKKKTNCPSYICILCTFKKNGGLKSYGLSVKCNKKMDRYHFCIWMYDDFFSLHFVVVQFRFQVIFNTSLCIYLYLKTKMMMILLSE